LEEHVLNWEAKKVEDALILSTAADMLGHPIPVVTVELEPLQEEQRLLIGPFTGASGGSFVLQSFLGIEISAETKLRILGLLFDRISSFDRVANHLGSKRLKTIATIKTDISQVGKAFTWLVFGGLTGWRPEGVSAMMWKWEVGGGPMGVGRFSAST
jgi:hypothetical protein